MPSNTTLPARRARLRRRIVGVAAAVTTGLLALGAGSGADAAPKTSAEAIAVEAELALAAFDTWEAERNPADYVRYVQLRDVAADLTASDLEVDAQALRLEWASASAAKQRAVLAAMTQLGVPYRSIASEPGVAFDCSGLTSWAFAQVGVEVPRVSGDQLDASEQIDRDAAEPGDLMHYPGHVGIYLGVGLFVHSPEPGQTVEARHLPERDLNWGVLVDG